MKLLLWIIVVAAVISGIVGIMLIAFNRAQAPPPAVPADGQSRPAEIPADWHFIKDDTAGYSMFYPPDWETDAALESAPQSGVRTFNTKERDPSEGFYIIRALFDVNESSIDSLDANFAKPFRDQAIAGTYDEERLGVQARASISMEANIKNTQTQEVVKAYLLLISSSPHGTQSSLRGAESDAAISVTGKEYGYAISAIARGPKTETFLEQARLMTRSLRIF